jgi:hypothetical protein
MTCDSSILVVFISGKFCPRFKYKVLEALPFAQEFSKNLDNCNAYRLSGVQGLSSPHKIKCYLHTIGTQVSAFALLRDEYYRLTNNFAVIIGDISHVKLTPVHPTIVSFYNVSAVKTYNIIVSLVRFQIKIYFLPLLKTLKPTTTYVPRWCCSCKCSSRRNGS